MAGLRQQPKPRARNRRGEGPSEVWIDDSVALAPNHRSRCGDAGQPACEGWIAHQSPGIGPESSAVAGHQLERFRWELCRIDAKAIRVEVAEFGHLAWGEREEVGDGMPCHLNPDRVDKHEAADPRRVA